MKTTKILFVCLGNICRSPTAEGVFRHLVSERGIAQHFEIDSAGTSDWHIGGIPDARTIAAAAARGYDLSSLRGRQASPEDFEYFDYVLAMDKSNLNDLRDIAPTHHHAHLGLFLDFGESHNYHEVPDPYYGADRGFELVLDLIEAACEGLIKKVLNN